MEQVTTEPRAPARSATWLADWRPEDAAFWSSTGSSIAWKTLAVTTITLMFSFATWFMMSAIVVRLPRAERSRVESLKHGLRT